VAATADELVLVSPSPSGHMIRGVPIGRSSLFIAQRLVVACVPVKSEVHMCN
jgi:hypothetical protein